jgi:hypothetical protein
VSDVDPLRARLAASRAAEALPGDWSAVRRRAAGLAAARRRRQRLVALVVALGAVVLVLPTPGLGRQLLDAIAARPARPALERYLERIPVRPEFGKIDAGKARELIDARSAHGTITLFEAASGPDAECLGLYAPWLSDPGLACGYHPSLDDSFAPTLLIRPDRRVLAISGTAPAAATSVRLETPRGSTSSPVVRGYFLLVLDPTAYTTTPAITVSAIDAHGAVLATRPVDLAPFFDPRCDQHTPGRLVRTVRAPGGTRVALHEATTVAQRCYWTDVAGQVVGGIWIEPLAALAYDPSKGPAIIVRQRSLGAGGQYLFGRAAVAATSATIHFVDGRSATVPLPDRYLLVALAPEERPDRIALLDRAGAVVGRVALP